MAQKKGACGCIITVEDADDQLCMYRAVAIAKAHKEWSETNEKNKDKVTIEALYKSTSPFGTSTNKRTNAIFKT